jgi:hypothetical protein
MHLSERTSAEDRLKEPASGMSEGLFQGLTFTGTEAVERNCKVVYTNS